jgi:metal-responsive CopG/Arc/MetJ family transcriptional regulator
MSVMKSHISATIDTNLLADLDRVGKEERRSRSQMIELALEEFLRKRGASEDEIVTSEGRFAGRFSRQETYER